MKKRLDTYLVLALYQGMKNEIKKKGNEKMAKYMTDAEVEQMENALNEHFGGEAESMAREQAMADMMLDGAEFDYQELSDYTNLVTDILPEAL